MQTKQEFAQFITQLFSKEDFKNRIAHFLTTALYPKRTLGIIVGDILTFYSVTRSKNTSALLLDRIMHNATYFTESYDNLTNLIINEITKKNKDLPPKALVNEVINNYVTNGFLLHAFSSANLESILEKGLDPRHRLFENERKILNTISHYDYEATSKKLYVTGNYRVLYSYGSLSPEWVYYHFKESKAMYSKNFEEAYSLFLERAQKVLPSPERLELAKRAAQKVFGFYLRKELNIQIAVLDKFAKNDRDEIIFKNKGYDEDEIDLEEYLNTIQTKEYREDYSKEELQRDILNIIRQFSPYERCAFTQFKKEEFGLIEMPSYLDFEKRMLKDNELEQEK
jgi:hypothetical protein